MQPSESHRGHKSVLADHKCEGCDCILDGADSSLGNEEKQED